MKQIIVISIIILFNLLGHSYAQGQLDSEAIPPFDSNQLSKYSTNELINYLTLESHNWHWENRDHDVIEIEIVEELVRRKDISEMINAFENPKDSFQKEKIVDALYPFDDPLIFATFKRYISPESTTETMYHCLTYLARRGDMEALEILNENYREYPVSSYEWSFTIKLFGRFHYMPATDNLINSLGAASLNLVDAAFETLYILYPNAPRYFDSPEDAIKPFKEYVNQLN